MKQSALQLASAVTKDKLFMLCPGIDIFANLFTVQPQYANYCEGHCVF